MKFFMYFDDFLTKCGEINALTVLFRQNTPQSVFFGHTAQKSSIYATYFPTVYSVIFFYNHHI